MINGRENPVEVKRGMVKLTNKGVPEYKDHAELMKELFWEVKVAKPTPVQSKTLSVAQDDKLKKPVRRPNAQGSKNSLSKVCVIDGVEYASAGDAARALGMSRPSAWKKAKKQTGKAKKTATP